MADTSEQMHKNIVFLTKSALLKIECKSIDERDIDHIKSCLLHILMQLDSYHNDRRKSKKTPIHDSHTA